MPLSKEAAANLQRTAANLTAVRQALLPGTPETATEEGLKVQSEQYLSTDREHREAIDKCVTEINEEETS